MFFKKLGAKAELLAVALFAVAAVGFFMTQANADTATQNVTFTMTIPSSLDITCDNTVTFTTSVVGGVLTASDEQFTCTGNATDSNNSIGVAFSNNFNGSDQVAMGDGNGNTAYSTLSAGAGLGGVFPSAMTAAVAAGTYSFTVEAAGPNLGGLPAGTYTSSNAGGDLVVTVTSD